MARSNKRPFGRSRAGLALIGAATMVPRWRLASVRWRQKRDYERRFMRRVAKGFVKRIESSGDAPGGPGTLFVANHISWLDIPVIASLIDAEFVAKDDVRGWPAVGAMARRTGTIFISRSDKRQTLQQVSEISTSLASGQSLVLFAEGTTSNGAGVLPFLSSLFEAARAAARVQPLAISYSKPNGEPFNADEMAAIGWTGDDELVPNALRLARIPMVAKVHLCPPVESYATRQALARDCHAAVSAAYAALRTANRSA